ncbi:TPA: hypothetical protein ACIAHZ_004012 [Enterobacter roggenkampii]
MPKKLTQEEITERLAVRGVTLLGSYKSNKTKTRFRCNVDHRHEWETTYVGEGLPVLLWLHPHNVIRGSGCPHCAWSSRFNTPPPLATPTIINAVKLAIGLAVGKCVDLDEAHEAEKLIREFVREHG